MRELLLSWLSARANSRDIVLAREEALCSELHATPGVLADAIATLEREGLADVLAPFPFLVLRLKKWPGRADSGASAYSSSLSHNRLIDSNRLADPALLREILETLGETNPEAFRLAVELYSPHVIRAALQRVRRARGIRKSRTALFRHLLPRLAREGQRAA
jgi:hypothetical protein